jgi:energy-converting hydrogenase Eha subunit E
LFLVFIAFFVASLLHMVEEYIYPGGFMTFMKRVNSRIAPAVTTPAVVIINGLQLVLCIAVILVGIKNITFSMSLAGLLFLNSLIHIGGCIRVKGYAPGVITGILLYLPLSIFAYYYFGSTGQLSLLEGVGSIVSGILYQLIPIAYFAVSNTL